MSGSQIVREELEALQDVLDEWGARKVFLVTGGRSFEETGAKERLDRILAGREVRRFSGFAANPQADDVRRGLAVLGDWPVDVFVAIGGGSVLDMAKLIRCFHASECMPEDYFRQGAVLARSTAPLVAAPTTAGSGSEATQFAVVYIDGVKHSVDDPTLLPDCAILDATLTYSMSPYLSACTGIDALCQAFESYWAVRSTENSRALSQQSWALSLRSIRGAVCSPTTQNRADMLLAAHLAGQAINIARTTAPHAFSYGITSLYGIPHGHAVSICFGPVLFFNSLVSEEDCNDPRGLAFARARVGEILAALGAVDGASAGIAWDRLNRQLGLDLSLASAKNPGNHARLELVRYVNPQRLGNNVRCFAPDQVEQLLVNL